MNRSLFHCMIVALAAVALSHSNAMAQSGSRISQSYTAPANASSALPASTYSRPTTSVYRRPATKWSPSHSSGSSTRAPAPSYTSGSSTRAPAPSYSSGSTTRAPVPSYSSGSSTRAPASSYSSGSSTRAPASSYTSGSSTRDSRIETSSVYRKPTRSSSPQSALGSSTRHFPQAASGLNTGTSSSGSSTRLTVPGYTSGSSSRFTIPAFPSSPTRISVPRRST